ncbi:MAG: ABC transporter substrate-binding protein [Planctomycetaceae bacterium]
MSSFFATEYAKKARHIPASILTPPSILPNLLPIHPIQRVLASFRNTSHVPKFNKDICLPGLGPLDPRVQALRTRAVPKGAVRQIPAGEEIVIGHYGSMTGSEATFGQSTDNGIKLAIEETNAAGGINGKQVKLITYDDKEIPRKPAPP